MTEKPMSDNEQWRRLKELADSDLKSLAEGAGVFGDQSSSQRQQESVRPEVEINNSLPDESSKFEFEEITGASGRNKMDELLAELRSIKSLLESMAGA